MHRLTVAAAVLRARGGQPLAIGLAASAVAWQLVPAGPVPVPGRDGAASLLWPLVPVLACLAVPELAGRAYGPLELTASRPAWGVRAGSCAVTAGGLLAVCAVAGRFDYSVAARNSVLLLGLALASAVVLPAGAAWAPVCVLPMAMWLWGAGPLGVERWAVLLRPAGDGPAFWAAAATGAAGVTAFCLLRSPLHGRRHRRRVRPRRAHAVRAGRVPVSGLLREARPGAADR